MRRSAIDDYRFHIECDTSHSEAVAVRQLLSATPNRESTIALSEIANSDDGRVAILPCRKLPLAHNGRANHRLAQAFDQRHPRVTLTRYLSLQLKE